MKLVVVCKSCKKDVLIKPKAATRPDLQMKIGEEFTVNCLNCGKVDKKHINDIRSEASSLTLIIGVIIGLLATVFLWQFYGAVSTVSMIIPLLFWQQELNAVKTFNSYLIRRK